MCENRVKVFGDPEQLAKVSQIFKDEKSVFNNIIQSPDWRRLPNAKGEFAKLEQMKNPKGEVMWETYNFPDGTNDDRWYHWCIDNWGTKWDVCDKSIEMSDYDSLEITFNTAWSPPEGIVERLREKYPELTFQCFYDEPGMEAAGYY